MCCPEDAVDENKVVLCCAMLCINCGIYTGMDCPGCSGKIGICCLNCEVCLKPGAPCLPCCCCGPNCEFDGCSLMKIQLQACCLAITGAFPCDEEVPMACSVLGCTVFPRCGCCVPQRDIMHR